MARTFDDKPAIRTRVPLLLGLVGPSSSGKTKSALRLADGLRSITGGEIFGIDTESRRMLHYADEHQFRHVEFQAPFGSVDYLEAIRYCVNKGASVVIIDSMSHEHEGPGGLLDFQDRELDRLAGDDHAKRDKMNMLAWQRPKAARRALINGMLQLNANFIFCFRAREKNKPIQHDKKGGKTEIVHMGFMPIAGEEFLFEQTANCLLLPSSMGVPTWQSEHIGERAVIKKPGYLASVFRDGEQLSEDIGRELAEWAGGKTSDDLRGDFLRYIENTIADATEAEDLANWWNSDEQKKQRRRLLNQPQLAQYRERVEARVNALKTSTTPRPPADLNKNDDMPSVGELFRKDRTD